MSSDLLDQLEALLGHRPRRVTRIGGGAAGTAWRVECADGRSLIVKEAAHLDAESRSISLLSGRSSLAVPQLVHSTPTRLIMTDLGAGGPIDDRAQQHAAELLANLHAVSSADGRFGLDFDNFIGPLPQPNGWSSSWVDFYRDRRLLAMTDAAAREGVLPSAAQARVRHLAGRLADFLPDRPPASLIHGDVWSGNVIARHGRIVGFIDPSPHYAHAEVELAFITLFGTFGPAFFDRYAELRPIDDQFWNRRRDVYLLYPLLTHLRIYRGGGYVEQLDQTLTRLRC